MSLEYPFPLNHAWSKDVLLPLVVITRSVELFVNYYCTILITLVVCDKIRLRRRHSVTIIIV